LNQLLQKIDYYKENLPEFSEDFLKIRPKSGGKAVPFKFNAAQTMVHNIIEDVRKSGQPVRIALCKGRQQGCSTYVAARFLHRAILNPGTSVFILAHLAKSTDYLFDLVKRMYNNLPDPLRPSVERSNKKELKFGVIDSEYGLGTSGAQDVGRGMNPHLLHLCVAEGSLVVDYYGRVFPIDNVNVHQGLRTHTNDLGFVSFKSVQEKPCLSLKVAKNNVPLLATKEHSFFTPSGFRPLKELKPGDEIGFPIKKIEEHKIHFDIRKDFVGNGRGGGVREKIPEKLRCDNALGKVLGLYVAEGCIKVQRKKSTNARNECAVYLSVHRREVERTLKWVKPLERYLASVKIENRKDSLTSNVILYGASFASFVTKMCGRTKDKHFPFQWDRAGRDFAEGLVEGYLSGDGHFCTKSRMIAAPSVVPSISFGLRDILVSLGYGWAGVHYRGPGLRHGRQEQAQYTIIISGEEANVLGRKIFKQEKKYKRPQNKGYYKYRISGGYVWQPITEITFVGDRKVYDLEIDHPDHSYCLIQGATHNSEAAFYQNTDDLSTGLMQGVATAPGTEIIAESTANGINNMFYNLCMKGVDPNSLSRFKTIFIPWYIQEEYRETPPARFKPNDKEQELMELYGLEIDQIFWRRRKLEDEYNGDLWKFLQEYPCCLTEAFQSTGDSLIKPELVQLARKTVPYLDTLAPMIMGVDGAGEGADRTSLVVRQGRRIVEYEVYDEPVKPMRLAGIIARKIDTLSLDMVFLDVAYGYGCRDRLAEMGYGAKTMAIPFGSTPLMPELYKNKRAQMYGFMKDWFEEGGCSIPDDDLFVRDILMIPGFKLGTSRGLLILPPKEKIKDDNGGISPDVADAMCFEKNTLITTPKGRVPIQEIKIGDRVTTPFGASRVIKTHKSKTAKLTTVRFSNGSVLTGKPGHKVFSFLGGLIPLSVLSLDNEIETDGITRRLLWKLHKLLFTKGTSLGFKAMAGTIKHTVCFCRRDFCTGLSTGIIMGNSRRSMLSTIKTVIGQITTSVILNLCRYLNTQGCIRGNGSRTRSIGQNLKQTWLWLKRKLSYGMLPLPVGLGIVNMENEHGSGENQFPQSVQCAGESTEHISLNTVGSAPGLARKKRGTKDTRLPSVNAQSVVKNLFLTSIGLKSVVPISVQTYDVADRPSENLKQSKKSVKRVKRFSTSDGISPTKSAVLDNAQVNEEVYNLTLAEDNMYYANGVLVENCLTFAFPIKSRGIRSVPTIDTPDVVRARSPYKSRRLAQSFVRGKKDQPSEFFVR
jgi:intein/homing endonuclease